MDKSFIKSLLKKIAIISAGVLLLFFISKCQESSSDKTNDLTYTDVVFLSTTDMHGKCWEVNFLTDTPEPHNMLRVSTVVNTMRDNYGKDNVIVIDNGDIFEGEAISALQLLEYENKTSDLAPVMAVCLAKIGYDGFVLGNHEFDYSWDTMKRIYDYLEENGVSVISANTLYDGSDGVYKQGDNVFTPYITKNIKVNGNSHTIGILGLENVDVPRWESKDKFPGMQFVYPGNESYSIAKEAQRYIEKMKEEGCEFIAVCYHGGLGNDEGELVYGNNSNHQGLRLIKETKGIDFLIVGHDHSNQYSNNYYSNSNGEEVLLVNGGGQDLTKSIFRFMEDNDGKLKWEIINSENLKLDDYAADEKLQEIIRPYAEKCKVIVDEPIGKLIGNWDGNQNFYIEQTDTIDLVLKGMIDTGTKALAKQALGKEEEFYSQYLTDHTDIDIAISTVSVRNGYAAQEGDISRKGVYRIFRYNNLLYVLPVKGSKIRDIMEENAYERLKGRVLDGKSYIYSFGDLYTDLLFGGISFTYDLSKEYGKRVNITGLSNGRKFSDEEVYLVATSDYLIGNEMCGLRDFTEQDSVLDKQIRIVDGVTDYIKEESIQHGGVVTDAFDWNWRADYSLTSQDKDLTAYATLASKPEDDKTYVLYNEASSRVIIDENGKYGTLPVEAMGNYLVSPLPENILMFTVNYVDEDIITLTNKEGKYLTSDKLNWLTTPEESLASWKLEAFNGGWRLISMQESTSGTPKAMELYKNMLSVYDLGLHTGFCFNFYEPNLE